MNPTRRSARTAGLLYLLMAVPAPFSLIYVPRRLIVRGDAAATAGNILAHETLFRTGIAAELFSGIVFVFLALALCRLLSGVNRNHAALMAVLVLLSIPVSFLNVASQIGALTLFHGPAFLSVFTKPQLQALAMLFLGLHGHGIVIAQIFWGLWLVPFGLLVLRSGFLPRILGVLLIINAVPYLFASLTSLVLPAYTFSVVNRFAFILELGELWIMLWLLIVGVKERPLTAEPV